MNEGAKVLDSRYFEFIGYLQKIGELHSTVKLIHSLSKNGREGSREPDEIDDPEISQDPEMVALNGLLFSFWQKGWIEIRERDRRGRDWHKKEYYLKIRLEEIAGYCSQGKNNSLIRSGNTASVSRQNLEMFI